MAAVSLLPSSQTHDIMTSRRVPLSTINNATNSPVRNVAAAAAKRSRSYSSQQRDLPYGGAPPPKRQPAELEQSNPKTPTKIQSTQTTEGRVFTKKTNNAQPTAFEKKLVAARERPAQRQPPKQDRAVSENLETIRQWQRHYRKVFPHFVFYFESIPEETRSRCSKQIQVLGAREEKFFSKEVTHVVTTRSIPPEVEIPPTTDTAMLSSNATDVQSVNAQPATINPAVLERSSEAMSAQGHSLPAKANFTFEAPLGKRLDQAGQESDNKRAQGVSVDVLSKAREMGMKIWALEKLQRMMTTMFNTDTGSQSQHGHNTRSNATTVGGRVQRGSDLSELLRNERLNGPSDRDLTVASRDLVLFKGPFIYIHDMDEKSRPIMVRDYPRVQSKEDGAWPMFRSVSGGKCPFIQEPNSVRRDWERELARERGLRKQKQMKKSVPETRANMAARAANMEPPPAITGKRPLAEMENGCSSVNVAGNPTKYQAIERPMDLSAKSHGLAEISSKDLSTSCSAFGAPTARLYGGEPVASGLQQSNITSAIRSQMISSTAAAPGAKAGLSKEVHELKRKVLQKNTGPPVNGMPASQRIFDSSNIAGIKAERDTTSFRNGRSKAQAKLKCVEEESSGSDDEAVPGAARPKKATLLDRKCIRRDPKPGYCENCREKFEDFEEHTYSRRHRKFAVTQDNWSDLDSLLSHLLRPLRQA